MAKIKQIFRKIGHIMPSNKIIIILFFSLIVVIGFFVFRSCTREGGLLRKNKYIIARDVTWYPLDLGGKEKNMLAFSNELITTITKMYNIPVEFVSGSANTMFQNMDEGRFDAVISPMAPTPINRQRYLFSDPFYNIGPVLIVKKDSDITSVEQMRGLHVGVRRGSNIVFYVTDYGIYYTPYDSMTIAFDDLIKNRIDGIMMPVLSAYVYTQIFYPGKTKIVTTPLTEAGLKIVASKSVRNQFLIEKFNKGLKKLRQDNGYDDMLRKWGLINPLKVVKPLLENVNTEEIENTDEKDSTP